MKWRAYSVEIWFSQCFAVELKYSTDEYLLIVAKEKTFCGIKDRDAVDFVNSQVLMVPGKKERTGSVRSPYRTAITSVCRRVPYPGLRSKPAHRPRMEPQCRQNLFATARLPRRTRFHPQQLAMLSLQQPYTR